MDEFHSGSDRSAHFVKLAIIERGVKSILCHQGFMVALLDDIPVLHNQDHIGVFDGGKAVGDDEAGTAAHQIIHGLLNLNLCPCIH